MNENENILPSASYPELYKQTILSFGVDVEIDVAIEELSELIKALLKNRRATNFADMTCNSSLDSKKTIQDVYEEMADVIIVLSQLVVIFGGEDEIRRNIDEKIARLEQRLQNAALQNVAIADLNLSTRVFSALRRGCINNLYDLSKCDLEKVRNLGEKGIAEINEALKNFTEE